MTHTRLNHDPLPRWPCISRIVVGGLVLSLSGCASLPPHDAQPLGFDVPATWSAADVPPASASSSLTQWWLRFDDPLLPNLVAQALQANTDVKRAE
ncbi:MAG: TolC family protein, partial [Thiobacillaceae bacterium]